MLRFDNGNLATMFLELRVDSIFKGKESNFSWNSWTLKKQPVLYREMSVTKYTVMWRNANRCICSWQLDNETKTAQYILYMAHGNVESYCKKNNAANNKAMGKRSKLHRFLNLSYIIISGYFQQLHVARPIHLHIKLK